MGSSLTENLFLGLVQNCPHIFFHRIIVPTFAKTDNPTIISQTPVSTPYPILSYLKIECKTNWHSSNRLREGFSGGITTVQGAVIKFGSTKKSIYSSKRDRQFTVSGPRFYWPQEARLALGISHLPRRAERAYHDTKARQDQIDGATNLMLPSCPCPRPLESDAPPPSTSPAKMIWPKKQVSRP